MLRSSCEATVGISIMYALDIPVSLMTSLIRHIEVTYS